MKDLIKDTYDEVQAVLLNSQGEPRREIKTALFAVLEFAQTEGEGLTKLQIRRLFEEVLGALKTNPPGPVKVPSEYQGCCGLCYNSHGHCVDRGNCVCHTEEGRTVL